MHEERPHAEDEKRYLTIKEAAEMLCVTEHTIRVTIGRGKLAAILIDGKRMLDAEDIRERLERMTRPLDNEERRHRHIRTMAAYRARAVSPEQAEGRTCAACGEMLTRKPGERPAIYRARRTCGYACMAELLRGPRGSGPRPRKAP